MLIECVIAAIRQVLSRPLRRLLWRSLALTAGFLALVWFLVTRGVSAFLEKHPLSVSHPILDGFAFFLAGAGLLIALLYFLPAVSAGVAGFFIDDAAEAVELSDFPQDPPGRALSLGRSLVYGLQFAGLALLVNMVALTLFFVPVINVGVFFAANAYLFGREYFELAAGRFRPMPEAAHLRKQHRATVLAAGSVIAALLLVPILNLITPLFGIALMVHVHKRIAAREALEGPFMGGAGSVTRRSDPRRLGA